MFLVPFFFLNHAGCWKVGAFMSAQRAPIQAGDEGVWTLVGESGNSLESSLGDGVGRTWQALG